MATTIALAHIAILLVDDPTRTEAFELWTQLPISTAALWLVFGPIWSVLFNWRAPSADAGHE